MNTAGGVILHPGPSKRPDMRCRHGSAWRCSHPSDSAAPAAVDTWLVWIGDPFFSYWVVGAISLDPARGFSRRALQFGEATHELAVLELDREWPPADVDRWENVKYVEPPVVKRQVELDTRRDIGDRGARMICVAMVEAIIDQGMGPVANHGFWARAIDMTARDIRNGRRRV